MYICIYI